MSDYRKIMEDIGRGKVAKLYVLGGETPYFARKIEERLINDILPEQARVFDLMILYGNEIKAGDIPAQALGFPMSGDYRLTVVREAQNLLKTAAGIKAVEDYLRNATGQNILSLRLNDKIPAKLKKALKAHKEVVIYESKRIYDNQLPQYIGEVFSEAGFRLMPKAAAMLAEAIGTDLLRAEKEAEKFALFFPPGTEITPALVEQYTGVSKEFNMFELKSAIASGQYRRAVRMAEIFARNPKEYPILAIVPTLYNFFVKLYAYHTSPHKSDTKRLSAELGVNPYFLREYQTAARLYSMRRVSHIIDLLHRTDLQAKGVDAGQAGYRDLLLPLIHRIMT